MPPLEAHLVPLDEDDQHKLLTQLTSDATRARTLLGHFERFGSDFSATRKPSN